MAALARSRFLVTEAGADIVRRTPHSELFQVPDTRKDHCSMLKLKSINGSEPPSSITL
jgi:hypothetical protein